MIIYCPQKYEIFLFGNIIRRANDIHRLTDHRAAALRQPYQHILFSISYNNPYISYNPQGRRVIAIHVRGIFAAIFVGNHSKPFNYKKIHYGKRHERIQ